MVLRRRRLIFAVLAGILLFYLLKLRGSSSKVLGGTPDTNDSLPAGVTGGSDRVVAEAPGQTLLPPSESRACGTEASISPLPQKPNDKRVRVQHVFDSSAISQGQRLAAVKEAFQHSWTGYKQYAWMKDELAPVSGGYRNTLSGWAATLVDCLDTLWIMGMKEEFEDAIAAIESIDFNTPAGFPINVFEITIRYLGGLLGAYDISNAQYPVLLKKAVEVADMLLEAFETPNRMPVLSWSKLGIEVASGEALMAEFGSLSLEFMRLSQLTGNTTYFEAIHHVSQCIHSQQMATKVPGLLPTTINERECDFSQGMEFSIGSRIDSAYEYMLKTHQLLSGMTNLYEDMYLCAVDQIKQHILFRPMTPTNAGILLAGTLKVYNPANMEFVPQMQHLACFAGGMFALGAKLLSRPADLDVAKRLVHGCIWSSNVTQTGIMPESFHVVPCEKAERCTWDEDAWGQQLLQKNSHDEKPSDKQLPMDQRLKQKAERLRMPRGMTALSSRQYKLRPEAIESIFMLYRITGDEALREHAWTMFQAIVKHTRTQRGYSEIDDVTRSDSIKLDKMESFWTAETLKYFYLIFSSPDVVSLDEWVFNTEAHPFKLG